MLNLLHSLRSFNWSNNIPPYKVNIYKKYLHFISDRIKYKRHLVKQIWR